MKIAIIGCGYIGTELIKFMMKKGREVTAITRTPGKLPMANTISKKCLLLINNDKEELSNIIDENDVIILTISASKSKDYEKAYIETANAIKSVASTKSTPKTLIYTSRSSIYGDHNGKWVDESDNLKALDNESKSLIESENIFLSIKELNWTVCILRLAHIYGPNKTLSQIIFDHNNQKLAGFGHFYTNMIHQKDVINAINFAISHNLEGIFNVVDDDHLTRQEFTDTLCKSLNIPKVKWDPEKPIDFPDANKRVSNYRLKEKGFSLLFPTREYL